MGRKREITSSIEDNLKAYFNQIKKARLLTFEEELDLSRRIQKGDETARNLLIESNLRLVVRIAKNYLTPEVSILDLIQEGNIGLMRAVSKYDYRKQVRFSTYASWWIKQSIVRSLSNKKRVIRLPHRQEEKLRKINKVYNNLSQVLMREPTLPEIAEEIGLEEDEVASIINSSSSVASLDSSVSADSGSLHDMVEDFSFDPDRELMKKTLREDTLRFLDSLQEKERQILLYRFSFVSGRRHTLKKIGDELGISPETVRQIEIRALKKLRTFSDELKEYVYN
ncbi:MAG TPA: RNA polymerase sigma factor RpoD/SigA [Spirochaetia bacterium]|nr:RNA polymerase sigma factor RpoD/SigA [Spirochaetia bacterium]